MYFLFIEMEIIREQFLIIKNEAATESCSIKQVFSKRLFLNVFFNSYKSIHFSTVAGLRPAALLKIELLHRYLQKMLGFIAKVYFLEEKLGTRWAKLTLNPNLKFP